MTAGRLARTQCDSRCVVHGLRRVLLRCCWTAVELVGRLPRSSRCSMEAKTRMAAKVHQKSWDQPHSRQRAHSKSSSGRLSHPSSRCAHDTASSLPVVADLCSSFCVHRPLLSSATGLLVEMSASPQIEPEESSRVCSPLYHRHQLNRSPW